MLIRELNWKPREEERFFDIAEVRFADGTLYVERGINSDEPDGYHGLIWLPTFQVTAQEVHDGGMPWERKCHEAIGEFEAQAVLDFYSTGNRPEELDDDV